MKCWRKVERGRQAGLIKVYKETFERHEYVLYHYDVGLWLYTDIKISNRKLYLIYCMSVITQ